ncbi:hypothetical protein HC251_17200 [Iamia sp. SCSIO 61187]|uniref:hypothetical protein n=1 Tax=Iamia sp. SCSIO 61187 TaxID=2722752 RepID=UPI001C631400|nr:hypothetical protein [Iamia sp. SCSIO 61187]QYG94001.1 hypothetical protein HC251_17200 [Iamia sp. SCSIO 61187]
MVFGVGSSYLPVSDLALSEMLVRDVGRHPLYEGLYSRDDWSHPGPLLYILLAPFYWLTGGSSIGLGLGTLAINGASVVGMGIVARRRAGTAAMVATFLAVGLLLRTLGADIWGDAWNLHVTIVPFALLGFLVWALLDGDLWVLPVAVFVTSFLAQTHVGFLPLAVPLLGVGVAGVALAAWRSDDPDRWRRLVRPTAVATAVGGVLWLPPLIDIVDGPPRNLGNIVRWFRDAEGGVATVGDGLKVVSGPFGVPPEWATVRQPFGTFGESHYLEDPVVPWLLLAVAVAGVVLWRRRPTGRPLLVVLVTMLALGVAAVARTVGPQFEYRLLWTWVPPVVAFVVVALAGWTWLAESHRSAARWVGAAAVACVAVLALVNGVAGVRAGTFDEGNSDVMAAITPPVVEAVEDVDEPVLVTDPFQAGAWYARGLVLQLERRGIEAVVPPERRWEQSPHRIHDGGPVGATLVVVTDRSVADYLEDPDLELIVEWSDASPEELDALDAAMDRIEADRVAGRIDDERASLLAGDLVAPLQAATDATFYRVAVFRTR